MAEEKCLVPVLSVFKNGMFLHTIPLQDLDLSEEEENPGVNGEELQEGEVIMVGRHPDCHIVMDHPSISRRHLEIQLRKRSRELLLTDLSSVHGTWVREERVASNVPVRIGPNDTFRLGASTRVYKLHWVSPAFLEQGEDATLIGLFSGILPEEESSTQILLDILSEGNKQECSFDAEKEQASKEDGHEAPLESDFKNLTQITLGTISESNNHEGPFDGEIKEQALNENGRVEAALESDLRSLGHISLDIVSELNQRKYLFDGENTEQALEENERVGSVESDSRDLGQISLEIISEPNIQEYSFNGEDTIQDLKEDGNVASIESDIKKLRQIYLDTPLSEPNKQECSFDGDNVAQDLKDDGHVGSVESDFRNLSQISSSMVQDLGKDVSIVQDLGKDEHVGSVESNSRNLSQITLGTISQPNKQELLFDGEQRVQALEENQQVVSVESDARNMSGICLDGLSESNKQKCSFDGENKEQVLREDEHMEAATSYSMNLISVASETNKGTCGFNDENKEQASKEEGYAKAVESISGNQAEIFSATVCKSNKQDCGFEGESEEHTSKAEISILHDIASEPNQEKYGFADENKEQALKEERCVKAMELDSGHLMQILLDGIPNKQECGFVDRNNEQCLKKLGNDETVVSLPWVPIQPSAPPLPESPWPSQQHKTSSVGIEAQIAPMQGNQTSPRRPMQGNQFPPIREKNESRVVSNLWSRRQKTGNLLCLQTSQMEMKPNGKKMKENQIKLTKQKRLVKETSGADILKENQVETAKKNRILDEKRDHVFQLVQPETSAHGSSSTRLYTDNEEHYPSDKENWTPKVPHQTSKRTTVNFGRVGEEIHLQIDTTRVPFQSLSRNSRVNNRPPLSSSLKNIDVENHHGLESEAYSVRVLGRGQHSNMAESKTKWHMVVDTGCLINKESRRALRQLEGIKGTRLIIPRIVIRELDCLKRRSASKKVNDASEILRWIEDCMVTKSWWIHVQSSAECLSVGVTPPASPHSSHLSDGSNDAVAFSSYGSFADVLSPTAEDHILEYALLFKRLTTNGHVLLLSNDVALKIKAMAEGMECENAKEFCESLVSPYSERFLWSQSTARGHNWTHFNNSNSSSSMMKKKSSLHHGEESRKKNNESAKGLKLILLHNSHYGQENSLKIIF